MDGKQVPQELDKEVGKIFEAILQEVYQLLFLVIRFTWCVVFIEFKFSGIQQLFDSTYCLLWTSHLTIGILLIQTDNVWQEYSEDMSILRALSIVFERKPELRSLLSLISNSFTTLYWSSSCVYIIWFSLLDAGWRAFHTRCFNGICLFHRHFHESNNVSFEIITWCTV